MAETLERPNDESAGSDRSVDNQRPFHWTRTHTIWLLIFLSLAPGGVVALFRDQWLGLPSGVRGAVYLTSAILIVAVCSLILTGDDKDTERPKNDS
jgi:hypothetical protein